MGGLNEGVDIACLGPERRDLEVAALNDPWIADEGPFEASLRRGLPDALRQRGMAFDEQTTIVWDEEGVQVLRAAEPARDVVALCSAVLLRPGFRDQGPERLFRIDYLRRGALLGSRFTPEGGDDA